MRTYCPNLFPFEARNDRLPYQIIESQKYQDSCAKKQEITDAILTGKSFNTEKKSDGEKRPKVLKEVFLANRTKFHSAATKEELTTTINEDELDTEDGHRVIQAIIR